MLKRNKIVKAGLTSIIIGAASLFGLGWYSLKKEKEEAYEKMRFLADTDRSNGTTHEEWSEAFNVLRNLGEDVHYGVHIVPKNYLTFEQIQRYNSFMLSQYQQEPQTNSNSHFWPRLIVTENIQRPRLG